MSFVVCYCRYGNQSSIATAIKNAIALRAHFPNYMAGFDLVGFEDKGHPLVYYVEELLYPLQIGVDLPYFLHAGETSK